PPLDLTPQRLKEKTLGVLVDRLLALAGERPLFVVIEDAHWIDPSSEDLVSAVMDRLEEARLLMVITHRPDYTPRWRSRACVNELRLNRLSRGEATAMVGELAACLPADAAPQIVAKADGVPLFLEELTKAVMEGDLLTNRAGSHVSGGVASI